MISVIVPAYNAEKTIKKCINGILNQTYKDLEVIVINDGSVDATEKVVKTLQEQDCRVKLISIPNGGVSHARNVGIDNATGDYITFVDSDDYVDEEMYDCLMTNMIRCNADISHCSYKNVENGVVINCAGKNDGNLVIQNRYDAIEYLLSGKLFSGGIWNKLYKKKLFEDVRFDENIKFNEDVLLNYYLFSNSRISVFIDKAFYNYVVNSSGATHSANSIVSGEDCKRVAEYILYDVKDKKLRQLAKSKVAYTSLVLYRAYLFSKDKTNIEKKKKLLKDIKDFKKSGLYESRKDKLSVVLFSYFPHIYKLLYKLYDKVRVKKLDPD